MISCSCWKLICFFGQHRLLLFSFSSLEIMNRGFENQVGLRRRRRRSKGEEERDTKDKDYNGPASLSSVCLTLSLSRCWVEFDGGPRRLRFETYKKETIFLSRRISWLSFAPQAEFTLTFELRKSEENGGAR